MFRFLAWLYFKLAGWKVEGGKPQYKKFIVIVLPHTSWFDFFLTKAYGVYFGIKSKGLVKKEMFFFPLNLIIKPLGAIPVDRQHNRRLAEQLINEFNTREQFGLTLTPEATRKKVKRLKRGFYYIAQSTGVPVLMGYIDFKTKRLGIGPELRITGDFDADIEQIRSFYNGMEGMHPDSFDASLLK
jgi:1-acyl-sn-glycerol-3-phosphate acyltransferase